MISCDEHQLNNNKVSIGTCNVSQLNGYCFKSEEIFVVDGKRRLIKTSGCLKGQMAKLTCLAFDYKRAPNRYYRPTARIRCCNHKSYCNRNISWDYMGSVHSAPSMSLISENMTPIRIIVPSILSTFIVAIFLFVIGWKFWKHGKEPPVSDSEPSSPNLSSFIKPVNLIANGRYSHVWYAHLNDDLECAVKIFQTNREPSWRREIRAYQECSGPFVQHPNILEVLFADKIIDQSSIKYVIVTQYHELGTLETTIRNQMLDIGQTINIFRSLSRALSYLHCTLRGQSYLPSCKNQKLAVAHCDIKASNILMNDLTGSCCLQTDFGMAIVDNDECLKEIADGSQNWPLGTMRYLAPELISMKADLMDFSTYPPADIYSLGLCMWEVVNRTRLIQDEPDREYMPAYGDVLGDSPSIAEVRFIVCEKMVRPYLDESIAALSEISKMIFDFVRQCWLVDPTKRPSAQSLLSQIRTFAQVV
ncbi:hypothetical protein ACOME3_002249 [Neoechinorhynchus agilis]